MVECCWPKPAPPHIMVDLLGQLSNPLSIPLVVVDQVTEPLIATRRPPRARQAQVRLTESEVDDLLDARLAGASILELASIFGIGRTTVMNHLRRRGVPTVEASLRWDEETLAAAIRAYNNGNSLSVIGQQYSLDPATIRRRLLAAGVILRPRRGWNKT